MPAPHCAAARAWPFAAALTLVAALAPAPPATALEPAPVVRALTPRWHIGVGGGKAWSSGQMDTVFPDTRSAMRLNLGYDWSVYGVELELQSVRLSNALDERYEVSSLTFGYRHYLPLHAQGPWWLAAYGRAGAGFGGVNLDVHGADDATLPARSWESERMVDHSGPVIRVGVGLVSEMATDLFGLGVRVSVDLTREWLWLNNEPLERHIHGGLYVLSGGLGFTF